MTRLHLEDMKFITEEIFMDFYENAINKNKSGEYDEDERRLQECEERLWNFYYKFMDKQ